MVKIYFEHDDVCVYMFCHISVCRMNPQKMMSTQPYNKKHNNTAKTEAQRKMNFA